MSETDAAARPAVGWIGLGAMGAPMAHVAAEAGFPVTAFDVNPAAAPALGELAPVHRDPAGALLPELVDMPEAATAIAEAVAIRAVADGAAQPRSDDDLRKAVRARRWEPRYRH